MTNFWHRRQQQRHDLPEERCLNLAAHLESARRLNLRQRLRVKGVYDEVLTNMNPRQLARLDAGQIQTMNRVFKRHRALLDYFGYELMHGPAA